MRNLSRYLVLASALLLGGATVALLAGCDSRSGEEMRSLHAWDFVLLDTSGSVTDEMREGYRSDIGRVLSRVGYGDHVTVAEITTDSLSRSDFVIDEVLPKFVFTPVERDPQRTGEASMRRYDDLDREAEKKQQVAFEAANDLEQIRADLLARIQPALRARPTRGTDILGALELAGNLMSENKGLKRLFIFSDMMIDDDRFRFGDHVPTGSELERLIEADAANSRLPVLTGVRVVVVGAYASTDARFREVRTFWFHYLEAAGAEIEESGYGRRLAETALRP